MGVVRVPVTGMSPDRAASSVSFAIDVTSGLAGLEAELHRVLGRRNSWNISHGRIIVVSPQCPSSLWWRLHAVTALRGEIVEEYAVDTVVPRSASKQMVEAPKKVNGNGKFTVYPEAGHDSWTAVYDDPELHTWLLKQQRKPKEPERKKE